MSVHGQVDLLVVGAGPAGLAAAEAALLAGCQRVCLWEAGPRAGRKFLLAGRSGLNLTRDADAATIAAACGEAADRVAPCVAAHSPAAIAAWAADLGFPTFVGTSGKVFPRAMQANGLLAAWLQRLQRLGLRLQLQRPVERLAGQADGSWRLTAATGQAIQASAVILALGGASWPSTGSDGSWQSWLQALGVEVAPLRPANCGIELPWDSHLRSQHAGAALKNLAAQVMLDGQLIGQASLGEAVITSDGLEGYCIYSLIPALRQALEQHRQPQVVLDLARGRSQQGLQERLQQSAKASFANRLRKAGRLSPAAIALLRQWLPREARNAPAALAAAIKALPLPVSGLRPLDEAISSAGGVRWSQLDDAFMLRQHPGLFCVGEMVDWEAPTGGYLLSVSLAMGWYAGQRVAQRCGDK